MNFVATNRRPAIRSVDFSEVRRSVPLTYFFEAMVGATAKEMSGTIRFQACPSCGPSTKKKDSNKCSVLGEKWNCFSCGEKGDVVEAAALFWGLSLKDAALRLMNIDPDMVTAYVPPKALPAVERDDSALAEVIDRLLNNTRGPTTAALNYFLGRGIPNAIVKEAVSRGILVTLPEHPEDCKQHLVDVVGMDLLVASGIWKADKSAPAAAFRPMMFVSHERKSAEFRAVRLTEADETKSLRQGAINPWKWNNTAANRYMMTEGVLDLLAALALNTTRSIIALPGCENWRPEWFEELNGKNALIAFDGDRAGQTATEKLLPVLVEAGAEVNVNDLQLGAKDINEQLILESPHVHLEFFANAQATESQRSSTLCLPGCDLWNSWQFGKLQQRRVVVRLGGPKCDRLSNLERLVATLKRGGAEVEVIR